MPSNERILAMESGGYLGNVGSNLAYKHGGCEMPEWTSELTNPYALIGFALFLIFWLVARGIRRRKTVSLAALPLRRRLCDRLSWRPCDCHASTILPEDDPVIE